MSKFVKFLEISLVEDLKYNLLSVSQICEQGNNVVTFTTRDVKVFSSTNELLFKGVRSGGTYIFDHDFKPPRSLCLASLSEQSTLWHQRLGHASLHLLHRLEKKNLVRGLPTIKPQDMTQCSECSRGKQTKSSFNPKQFVSTKFPLDLIHMDLCRPMRVQTKGVIDTYLCLLITI